MTVREFHAVRIDQGRPQPVTEPLTVESPLLIRVNGKPYMTTLRTPGEDVELVRGLLFTDSVVNARRAPFDFTSRLNDGTGLDTLDVTIPAAYLLQPVEASRATVAASSCGLCGTLDPTRMDPSGPPLLDNPSAAFSVPQILELFAEMGRAQTAFASSGGSHAAGAFDASGSLLLACEDIGRHNAVDKVIGGLLQREQLDQARCLTVSGRISYEIALKAYRAGIPVLAAVSAPSSLAVEFARKFGLTLAGFCRQDRLTVYAHPNRIIAEGGSD